MLVTDNVSSTSAAISISGVDVETNLKNRKTVAEYKTRKKDYLTSVIQMWIP